MNLKQAPWSHLATNQAIPTSRQGHDRVRLKGRSYPHLWLNLLGLLLFGALAGQAQAQSLKPANDGTGTIVTPNGNQTDIAGGKLSGDGTNLFHSFGEFGLSQNQIANFLTNPAIQNILTRVNGGNPSIINGLIQVTGGNSNLFLINPSGILFGSTASLNVPASFTATTANGIGFGNQQWLNAIGSNDYNTLGGNPTSFAFTMSQPGAIVNAGSLTAGQNLSLIGGTIASTGQVSAPNGQVTLAAIPGQTLVRLSQAGNLLSLDLQPIASNSAQPAGWSFPIATLPQMLTGGTVGNATNLTVTPNGAVELTGSGVQVENGDVVANTIAGQNATLFANRNLTLVESSLKTTGDLTLFAKDTVLARDSVAKPFLAQAGGNLTLQGNQKIDILALNHLSQTPFVSGKNLNLISGGIISGDAHFSSGGRFSVLSLSGAGGEFVSLYDPIISSTEDVTFGSYTGAALKVESKGSITVNGNITITTPDTGLVSFCSSSSCSTDAQRLGQDPVLILRAGVATLEEPSFGYPGTRFATVSPTATFEGTAFNGAGTTSSPASVSVAGTITTAPTSDPFGSSIDTVTISAPGNISTGDINTSYASRETTSDAKTGNVTLNAGGSILTGAIDTSVNIFGSVDQAKAGNVTLTAGKNIVFSSINTSGLSSIGNGSGGTVALLADSGTVRGVGFVPAFPTSTIYTASDDIPSGAVEIRHDGGLFNNPFSIGDAATNGTAGTIETSNGTIPTGTQFGTVGTVNQGDPRVNGARFTFNNVAPSLSANSVLSGAQENQPYTFTLADLAPIVSDFNADVTSIQIDSIALGTTLTIDGVLAVPGAVVTSRSTLQYIPPADSSGTFPAFTLTASDRVSTSIPVSVAINVAKTPSLPPEPQVDPKPQPDPMQPVQPKIDELEDNPEEIITGNVPEEVAVNQQSLLNIDPFVGELEESVTGSFETYLNETADIKELPDVRQTLSTVGEATGVKPALVYALFVPERVSLSSRVAATKPEDSDQLELFIVTAGGQPIRKRVPGVTRAKIVKVAQTFEHEVSDPRKTQTLSYLPSAQQLYQWMIAPLEAELKSRNIKNLVFITDAGLRSIPFAALHDGHGFLIERFSIGMMPSISLTDTRLGDIKHAQLLAMGASTFAGQSPLPAVPLELDAVLNLWKGKSFLNEQFTLSNLKAQRQQQPFGIIHLATHAEFRPGEISNSYIQLSDTQLQMNQIRQLGWNNPPVELLVLSACRTALGDKDAELGFAGLAVKSGVKSALASLWYVSDEGTLSLMTEFYQRLKTAPIKAEALREAQLALLKGQPAVSAKGQEPNKSLSHPYYWATFTMIGSPW